MSTVALCVYCESLPEKSGRCVARTLRCPLCHAELGVNGHGERFRLRADAEAEFPIRLGKSVAGLALLIVGAVGMLVQASRLREASTTVASPVVHSEPAPAVAEPMVAAPPNETATPLQPAAAAAKPYLRGIPGRSKPAPFAEKQAAETPKFAYSARALPPPKTILYDEATARALYRLADEQVPEVSLQQAPPKDIGKDEARRRIVEQTKAMRAGDQKEQDGFVRGFAKERPDLARLPFVLGTDCRRDQPSSCLLFGIAAFIRNPRDISTDLALGDAISRGSQITVPARAFEPSGARPQVAALLEAAQGRGRNDLVEKVPQRQAVAIAALVQILSVADAETRCDLVEQLGNVEHPDAGRTLVRFALFDVDRQVRAAAIRSLHLRKSSEILEPLLAGFRHPWPAAALHAGQALVALGLNDAVPQLIDLLDGPDVTDPITLKVDGNNVPATRELVKINHLRNCQLCHAAADDKVTLQAQVPSPAEPLPRSFAFIYCGDPQQKDLAVRPDVTYLRQEFSLMHEVAEPGAWPKRQRFDYLVRTRPLTEKEIAERKAKPASSLQREFALATLRTLTWQDHGPTAAAWRRAELSKLPRTSAAPLSR